MKLLAKVSKQINTIIPASNTIYEVICNRVMCQELVRGATVECVVREGCTEEGTLTEDPRECGLPCGCQISCEYKKNFQSHCSRRYYLSFN